MARRKHISTYTPVVLSSATSFFRSLCWLSDDSVTAVPYASRAAYSRPTVTLLPLASLFALKCDHAEKCTFFRQANTSTRPSRWFIAAHNGAFCNKIYDPSNTTVPGAGECFKLVNRTLLELRGLQPLPRGDGKRPLFQGFPGRLHGIFDGKGPSPRSSGLHCVSMNHRRIRDV